MNEEIAQPISLEEFDKYYATGNGRNPSRQLLVIRSMQPGTAIRLSHEGLSCGGVKGCSLSHMVARENNIQDNCIYKSGHDKATGDVLVACYAKEQGPQR